MPQDSLRLIYLELAARLKEMSRNEIIDFLEKNKQELFSLNGRTLDEYEEILIKFKSDIYNDLLELKGDILWDLCLQKDDVFYFGYPLNGLPDNYFEKLEDNNTIIGKDRDETNFIFLSIDDAKHLLNSSKVNYTGNKNQDYYNSLNELGRMIDFAIKNPKYGIVYMWDF